jgi:hypothetical protein
MVDKLTLKQNAFVKAYTGEAHGNASLAAKRAGYNAANEASLSQIGHANLKNRAIKKAIDLLVEESKVQVDMSPEGIKRWWATVMHDPTISAVSRIRASELLAKAVGVFPLSGMTQQMQGSGKIQSIQIGDKIIEFGD